jgi:UDP-3-O-[3-hydroxymyristoyl] glucosamine N-acyltransferase
MKLSVLKNASSGTITYYVGDNIEHVSHLKDCILICKEDFNPKLENVKFIYTEDPQLYFYKLSRKVDNNYTFNQMYEIGKNTEIHSSCIIGDGVVIGDNVSIGPNTVIYSKTIIRDNVRVDANCTIGAEGMMWVWENDEKVFLKQLGGVIIEENCIIGSNSVIVRGSANENTILNNDVNMAPGCMIGHGCQIGKYSHFANGVKLGGSSSIGDYNFLGSGSIISAGVKICVEDVIIGAGSTVLNDIKESGVYVGTPAKKIKESVNKLSGIPKWRK